MLLTLNIMLACGAASVIRYFLSKLNAGRTLPLGTLLVNTAGAFLLGYFYQHIHDDKGLYIVLATGFCGGLTTFSTLNAELLEGFKEPKSYVSYLVLTYALGLLAIFLGISL